MKQLKRTITVSIALLTLVAGCAAPAPDPVSAPASSSESTETSSAANPAPAAEENAKMRYDIQLNGGEIWTVDRDGNTLAEEVSPPESEWITLYDQLTRAPQCQMRIRKEDTGERDEYGNVSIRTLATLYDMDGKILYEESEYSYDAAFGDYLIRNNDPDRRMKEGYELGADYQTALWNFKTGELHLDGVDGFYTINSETALLLNQYRSPIGTMDREGNKLHGFPIEGGYYSILPWNEYLIANTHDPERPSPDEQISLLSFELQPLFSTPKAENAVLYEIAGGYLLYRNDTRESVLSVPDGKELLSIDRASGDFIKYFDGKRAIIERQLPNTEPLEWNCRLVKADGTILLDGYERIIPDSLDMDDLSPVSQFITLKDGKIERIDYDAKVLASAEMSRANDISTTMNGFYRGTVGIYTGLLDADLKVLIPPDTYTGIFQTQQEHEGEYVPDSFLVGYKLINNVGRYDLLDSAGKPFIQNITDFGTIGNDRISIRKGFEVGLIDYEGNWIVKRPLFTDLAED